MAIDDLEELERKLTKRGFRRGDALLHDCPDCKEHAVLTYRLMGKTGGRDISLCQACGISKSWRCPVGLEARELDPSFELRKFLAS
jgi:transcription elongation factor Elf1